MDKVHVGIARDEYESVMDHALETNDPVDRESGFLETEKAWRGMMSKNRGENYSHDEYLIEYSALCMKNAYVQRKSEISTGVQESISYYVLLMQS